MMYEYELETADDILKILSYNINRRRLEKGLSRENLSAISGVPTPTIVRFEKESKISLSSFVSLCMALGYKNEIKGLLDKQLYSSMEELELIKKNKNRKRGRYVIR